MKKIFALFGIGLLLMGCTPEPYVSPYRIVEIQNEGYSPSYFVNNDFYAQTTFNGIADNKIFCNVGEIITAHGYYYSADNIVPNIRIYCNGILVRQGVGTVIYTVQ
jgi:hypothetical protein